MPSVQRQVIALGDQRDEIQAKNGCGRTWSDAAVGLSGTDLRGGGNMPVSDTLVTEHVTRSNSGCRKRRIQ